ncbi:MAG: hypothetical protein L0G39_20385 [Chryseobacterium sp.]|nr:hypothetical protein [Chryseobacterium sp.]
MSELQHQILDKKSIIKQMIIAIVVGTVLLVSAVLPAEFGIDPLGIGKITGFNRLYIPEEENTNAFSGTPHEVLTMAKLGSGKDVPRPAEADNPPPAKQLAVRTAEASVVIPAGKGLEYKVNMLKYGVLEYEWKTDKGEVYLDMHGEVKGNHNFFESYLIAYSSNMTGTLIAPFEGPHGWYFKNNGKEDITVKVKLKGQFLPKE